MTRAWIKAAPWGHAMQICLNGPYPTMNRVPERIWKELLESGLLMESDRSWPSVSGIIAGEPVKGSWWSHPKGREIWLATENLAASPEVTIAKLIDGKVTYIHKDLWPSLYAVGASRKAWQIISLSSNSKKLLALIDKRGAVRTDLIAKPLARASRDLENRLLIHSEEIHTEAGAHARALESWPAWAKRKKLASFKLSVDRGEERLERIVMGHNKVYKTNRALPWRSSPKS